MAALSGREYDNVGNNRKDYNDKADDRATLTEINMSIETGRKSYQ